ncbi:GNAT family N-acetyltransferase [Raoultibacter phocaeensis]|uniref:GNAT family N-acetyltransferase n=1 Tax=Raoultibacter phocaeensis TaxID=2479841 RepID=UPI001118E39A|nr:GNAT family N-acetyltransferase [Raoultibacter phocaeensis]
MSRTPENVRLRPACIEDARAILALYAPYVEDSPITFETEVPPLASFEARMADIVHQYPYLVAERSGAIVGYAYAHPIGERAAYAWNAELSVYLGPSSKGAGLGRALSTAVLDLLAIQGIRNVFSLITVPNEASVGLHEALGFNLMGVQRQAGFKCGAWHDVAWYQKQIGSFSGEPAPIVPFPALDAHAVDALLERALPAQHRTLPSE